MTAFKKAPSQMPSHSAGAARKHKSSLNVVKPFPYSSIFRRKQPPEHRYDERRNGTDPNDRGNRYIYAYLDHYATQRTMKGQFLREAKIHGVTLLRDPTIAGGHSALLQVGGNANVSVRPKEPDDEIQAFP